MSGFDFLSPNNVLGAKTTKKLARPRPPRAVSRSATTTSPRIAPTGNSNNTLSHDPNTGRVRTRAFSMPVREASVSSNYGPRVHPITGRSSSHTGMDFAAGMGTPIYAPRGGLVEELNLGDSIYGNQLIMRHGPKLQTMYGHMERPADIEPGQRVKRGDVIGYVGSTGLSTGPHLHWETWKNGNPIDPNTVLDRNLPRRLPRVPGTERKSNRELPDLSEPPTEYDVEVASLLNPMGAGRPMPGVNAQPNMSPVDQLRAMARGQGRGPGMPQNGPARNPQLQAFLQAISTQESGDDYNAVGVDTGGGHRAYGKYQIMDFNINGPGGWDQEALGHNIDIEQFLNTPDLQEQIARYKLRQYFKEYGPEGAAKAWYAGPGNAYSNSNSPQYGGPSINGYANSVLKHMQSFL